MRIGDYYRVPEKRGAGAFLACCITSLAWLFVVTLVLRSIDDLETIPASVWHALGVSVDMGVVVLGFGLAWMLLIWPAWQLLRRGEAAAKSSLNEGIKPMEFGLLAMLGAAVFFLPTILMIGDHDLTSRLKCYRTYEEYDDPAFGGFMVPEGAVDIRRYYDCGFGYQSCDISCTVGIDGLKSFADAKGYVFSPLEWVPLFSESPVTKELDIDSEDCTNYLYCAARNSEHRVPLPGWGDFGNLTFVYDIRNRRLYASYYD